MKKRLSRAAACGALLLTLCLPSGALSAPHISDFNLDLTRDGLSLRKVTEQDGRLAGAVELGGLKWNGSFVMNGDKVAAITLSGPASEKYMAAATLALESSPYVLQSAVTDRGVFDFRRAGAGQDAFASFLRQAGDEGCSFAGFLFRERGNAGGAPGNVGCMLSLDASGISLIIMRFDDLNRELNARMGGTHMAAGENTRD